MKARRLFEPNLVLHELAVPRGGEWRPRFHSWSFAFIKSGISYLQHPGGARELPAGSAIVFTGADPGGLRASQLSEVVVAFFRLELENLTGLLSLDEQQTLRTVATRDNFAVRVLPPGDPVSERFGALCREPGPPGLSRRLQLLQLFIDVFKPDIEAGPARQSETDGRGRLRELLKQFTASELVGLSLTDLAPRMRCSPRHLSRLFRQEVGASFREKQTELRLARACDLLANSRAKVVDVALTSGYHSNSLFNLMFKKRFGVSPGAWRRRQERGNPRRQKFTRLHAL